MKTTKISDSTWKISVGSHFKDGKISGAFSPFYAAQHIAQAFDETLLGILNVDFKTTDGYWDSRIYNEIDERTGYGFHIAIFPHWIVAYVDRGQTTETPAACYNEGEVDLSKDTYQRWHSKLSPERLTEMMQQANTAAQAYKAELHEKMKKYRESQNTTAA